MVGIEWFGMGIEYGLLKFKFFRVCFLWFSFFVVFYVWILSVVL